MGKETSAVEALELVLARINYYDFEIFGITKLVALKFTANHYC